MPSNVKHAIKGFGIMTLEEAMVKEYEMEENMLEINTDLELILGKVQRHMYSLLVNPYHVLISRTREGSGIGRR